MAAEQNPNPDALPPLAPDQLPPVPRITTWPTKLGIVAILFAVFGGATSGLTLATVLALRYSPRAIEAVAKTDAQKDFMRSSLVQTWLTASSIGNALFLMLAVVLLVCAIGLIRRRAWSVKGLSTWAGLKVILEVGVAGLDYVMYSRIGHAIDQGLLESANVPKMFSLWSVNTMIFTLALICALPVFVLIWLARVETREEVAMWR